MSHLPLAAALLAAALIPADGVAQEGDLPRIRCLGNLVEADGQCRVELPRADTVQRVEIALRVVSRSGAGLDSALLRLRASSGRLVADSVWTDLDGNVRAFWYRVAGSDSVRAPARITVGGMTKDGPVFQSIEVRPPDANLVMIRRQPFPGVAMPDDALSRPLIIEIAEFVAGDTIAITDAGTCRAQRVVFRKQGLAGTVTPDTADGLVYLGRQFWSAPSPALGCFITAGWQVGPALGRQRVRAELLPAAGYRSFSRPLLAQAVVRPPPRFILGPALRLGSPYLGRNDEPTRTYRVERMLPSGEKATFDSIYYPASIDSVGGTTVDVMAGVSVPLPFYGRDNVIGNLLNRARFTAGVKPDNPRRDQYAGFSVLHLLPGISQTYPIEVHVLHHWSRIDRLKDPVACAAELVREACATEQDHGSRGWAFAASFDASSAIAEVIKNLGL